MRDERIALLAERLRRQQRAAFDAPAALFELQRAFVEDYSRLVAICAARRAGKTHSSAYKLLRAARSRDSCNVVYTAITLGQAVRNIWARLLATNEEHALGGVPNLSKHTLTMPNRSVIHLSGLDEIGEADKWRGVPWLLLAILDEAQSYRADVIDYAVNEVFRPGMLDLAGSQLVLSGSPGPLPVGYFYDVIHGPVDSPWSRHGWDIFSNSKLEGDPWEVIREACTEKGITEDAPWIQRSFFNRWVQDLDSLIFPYDSAKNAWCESPAGVMYTVGVDFGLRDADAIVVWAIYERTGWVVEQHCNRGQTTDTIIAQVKDVVQRYQPVDLVGDPSGGGARIAEDLSALHGIAMRPADKRDRIAAINLMADAMRSGRIKAPEDSRLVREWKRMEWEPGKRGVTEKRRGPHFDLPDAALYGWRAATQFFALEATPPVRRVLSERERWELRMAQAEEKALERESDPEQDWAERDWR